MRLPRIIVPIFVTLALAVGLGLRGNFDQPTLTKTFTDKPGAKATFIVDGVRCRGTATLFASLYEDVPGVHAIVAFASERKAVFTFDAGVISRERIRAIMEAPIPFEDGTTNQVFQCLSVK
jgi:hypothetical protein